MCSPRPALSLAILPRAASGIGHHAGVDASSSVPAAPILGQSRPGFGRRDLDPLDRRRGRDAADHAAFRGSPALAPRLRAPRIPTRRHPARPAAPPSREISPLRPSLGRRTPSPPLPSSRSPSPSLPPEGPTTKIRSITGPTSKRRASPSARNSSPHTTRASPAWRRTPPARRTARGSTSTCGGASTSAWRPTSSRTPSEPEKPENVTCCDEARWCLCRTTEPRRRLVDLSYPRRAGQTRGSDRGSPRRAISRAISFAVALRRTVSEPFSAPLPHPPFANHLANDTPSSDVRCSSAGGTSRSTRLAPARLALPSASPRLASSAPPAPASRSTTTARFEPATCSSGPKTSMSGAYIGRVTMTRIMMTGTRNARAGAFGARGVPMHDISQVELHATDARGGLAGGLGRLRVRRGGGGWSWKARGQRRGVGMK